MLVWIIGFIFALQNFTNFISLAELSSSIANFSKLPKLSNSTISLSQNLLGNFTTALNITLIMIIVGIILAILGLILGLVLGLYRLGKKYNNKTLWLGSMFLITFLVVPLLGPVEILGLVEVIMVVIGLFTLKENI